MKYTPITRRDQAKLIQLLGQTPEFHGTRGGAKISLSRKQTLWGQTIVYHAKLQAGDQIAGEANTVAAAVDALNSIINGRKTNQ